MARLLQDVRVSARLLARSKGFTAVAVLILGLGIGATSTVFSITNALLFRPLNGGATRDLVRLYGRDRDATGGGYRRFSYPNFQDLRRRRDVFAELAAYDYGFTGVTEGNTTRRVMAGFVSSSYFPLLGVPMARGRAFTPADDEVGAPPVVIVSHEFWTAAGSDPGLVGQTLTVGGRSCTVVGITPPGFTGTMAVTGLPLWLPLGQTGGEGISTRTPSDRLADRNNHAYGVVGRLADGLTLASAAPRLDVLSRALEQAYPVYSIEIFSEIEEILVGGDAGSVNTL